MAQVEIWTFPGMPLKEKDWLNEGYNSLEDYVQKLILNHDNHQKISCKICLDLSREPIVSFGSLNNKGEKEVKMVCKTLQDLPSEDIPDVLIFDKK